jgi:hypothetical protein
MNARLVRHLAGLYPPEWRIRYRQEFQDFLAAHPSNLRTILNVVGWAMCERIFSLGRFKMDRRQHSLTLMLFAYLAAIAGGVNFYWTVDDTPLATAMRDHAALSASWNLILAGSVLALAAVAMVGIPMLLTMKRRDVVYRLTRRYARCVGRDTVPQTREENRTRVYMTGGEN